MTVEGGGGLYTYLYFLLLVRGRTTGDSQIRGATRNPQIREPSRDYEKIREPAGDSTTLRGGKRRH